MSWRDQLRKAKFRNAEFLTDSADGEFGRRTVVHEYPLRDKPYVEDLGRKARVITLEAYVLATAANGLNYMPGRDAMIAALEEAGPGLLVHPYLGELRVSVTSSKLRETTAEGGMARFTLTFTEAGEATFPTGQVNTPSIVNARADTAVAAIEKQFAEKFAVTRFPEFVANAAHELLGNVTDLMKGLPNLTTVDMGELAQFMPSLDSLTADLDGLMAVPGTLASSVTGQIDALRRIATRPQDALKLLRKLFSFGSASSSAPAPSVPSNTPSRVQQSQNQEAVLDLVQGSAVIAAARASSEIEFVAFQDATEVRDDITVQLDGLMERTESDEVYNSLAALRSAVVKDVSVRGANLARVVNYTPAGTVPALVLAYGLYEDAERDTEIVARNAVRHPGFVPGGRALEVLADA